MTFVRSLFCWLLGLCLIISVKDLSGQGLQASARLLSLDFNHDTNWNPFGDGLKFPSGGGLFVGYTKSRYLTFGGDIRLGQVTNADADVIRDTEGENIFAFTGAARLQHTGSSHWIKPYLQVGAGAQLITNEDGVKACINVGAGLDFKIYKNIYLNLGSSYTREISRNRYFLDYGIGLTFALKEADEKSPEKVEEMDEIEAANRNDFDSDGLADVYDDCPDVPGTLATNGCPDADGDGIADHLDSCPGEAGLVSNDGCPVEDSVTDLTIMTQDSMTLGEEDIAVEDDITVEDDMEDLPGDSSLIAEDTLMILEGAPVDTLNIDGISEEADTIPDVARDTVEARMPISRMEDEVERPADIRNERLTEDDAHDEQKKHDTAFLDSDGDGIADHIDQCPEEAGKLVDMGCPVEKEHTDAKTRQALENEGEQLTYKPRIHFPTGIAAIQTEDVQLMKEIAEFLKRNEDYRVMIYGHTDNTGGHELNEVLSQRRAHACYLYLRNLGVPAERMSYEGQGEDQPVSDNATVKGKRDNRRSVFIFTKVD